MLVDGQDVSEEIRSQQVTTAVSAVAAHSGVRELMVEKQRILGRWTWELLWMVGI